MRNGHVVAVTGAQHVRTEGQQQGHTAERTVTSRESRSAMHQLMRCRTSSIATPKSSTADAIQPSVSDRTCAHPGCPLLAPDLVAFAVRCHLSSVQSLVSPLVCQQDISKSALNQSPWDSYAGSPSCGVVWPQTADPQPLPAPTADPQQMFSTLGRRPYQPVVSSRVCK